MSNKRKSIMAVLLACSPSACLTPNVMCFEQTYHLSGAMSGNSPVAADFEPVSLDLSCVNIDTGVSTMLEGYVSATEQVYTGEIEVTSQNELKVLDDMMAAIEAGTGSSMSVGHQDAYTEVIETMLTQVHAGCVDYLTDEAYINCTVPSSDAVCNAYLTNPMRARYLDFDLGASYERPLSVNSGVSVKGAGGWCQYYKNPAPADTDGSAGENESSGGGDTSGGGPTGADESSGADETSGVDDTGEEAEEAPFGEVKELVHCNRAQTSCTYAPSLIENVFAASGQVEADGALLRLLDPADAGYPGVRLQGFDRREPSTELAASVGLENGDILRTVDGTTLKDEATLMSVLERLLQSPEATIVYDRGGRTREVRIEPR